MTVPATRVHSGADRDASGDQIGDRALRIVIVNDVWDVRDATADAVLERFTTLTGWADAIAARHHEVVVLQRFRSGARSTRGSVSYEFIPSGGPPRPDAWFPGERLTMARAASLRPDIVHVNGLDFPRAIRRLRAALAPASAIAVQDHGGFDPATLSISRRLWLRHGLGAADALLVAAPPQIDLFRGSGLVPAAVPIRDVMEGSTTLRARRTRRDSGRELSILCVGRLNANKDPLTVLAGFARFTASRPDATLTFVYNSGDLEPDLRRALDRLGNLTSRVRLAGEVRHDLLADIYADADLFVSGSHREGSGYAALEALACGAVPVLTAIPSFRWLTQEGAIGALWTPGDPASLADALARAAAKPREAERAACRRIFDERFSWEAIGRRAVEIYRDLGRA